MDLNKLTMKSQAALQEAHQQATVRQHQLIEPEHVLFALLGDPDGLAGAAVLGRLHHEPLVLASCREQLVPGLDVSDDGHAPIAY